MLRDAEHVEGRNGGPDHEVALVAEGQFEHVGELAVDDGEEDGVFCGWFALGIGALAEDEPE